MSVVRVNDFQIVEYSKMLDDEVRPDIWTVEANFKIIRFPNLTSFETKPKTCCLSKCKVLQPSEVSDTRYLEVRGPTQSENSKVGYLYIKSLCSMYTLFEYVIAIWVENYK